MSSMYIDDIRAPKGKFDIIVRNSEDAKESIIRYGCPRFISFDHDLGGEDTSMEIVKWLVEMDMNMHYILIPSNFEFNVHSANPVGKANIEGYLNSYLKQRTINE